MRNSRLRKPNQTKYIFSEGINYLKTGKRSIWGAGDRETLDFLNKTPLHGKWLHLAAGDGRYNSQLLKKVDHLVVSDIEEGALIKLRRNTPRILKKKLRLAVFDITKKFPLRSRSLEGILCFGTLHLFPKEILKNIVKEISRILKPGGMIIIDFPTHIKRERFDGKPYVIRGEPHYSNATANTTLRRLFAGYRIRMMPGNIPPESYPRANPPYTYSSKFILLTGTKGK
ncbi:MAG: class I SAM-dependent methyltransferase [Patescibacteria group bacterium]